MEACPTGALTFGDLDDPTSLISTYVAEKKIEVFHPEYGTKPAVMYVGIPKRFVAGEVVRADDKGECAEGAPSHPGGRRHQARDRIRQLWRL